MTEWYYKGNPLTETPEEFLGFCYCITNNLNGRKYLGRKIFKTHKVSVKTITQKNGLKKKKKTKIPIDSDWKTYYGSSSELATDVLNYGSENFSREIIHLCKSKSELSYWETYYIFKSHCLLDPTYYNSWVTVRVRKDHLNHVKKEDEYIN